MINAFSIHKNPIVRENMGTQGLHNLLEFDGIIFADSGGFDLQDETDPPSPEEILNTQKRIGADIYATLDLPVLPDMNSSEKNRRVNKSIEFAKRMSEEKDDNALLFATIHGDDPRTIRNSIRHLEKNGEFDGFALGGMVPIRSNYSKVIDLVLAARDATDKHLHVFGLGGLLYQPLLIYLGVDSFDSSAFIRCGSHRRYFVPGFGDHTMSDFSDLENLPCACPVCSEHTLDEVKASRDLVTQHNLWALTIELRRFKWMIETGEDIEDYLDLRFQGNDVTQRAYKIAKQKVRKLT